MDIVSMSDILYIHMTMNVIIMTCLVKFFYILGYSTQVHTQNSIFKSFKVGTLSEALNSFH